MAPPSASTPSLPYDTVLCDLDGVIWLAHEPIPGSAEAIAALRDAGARVLFVTNNSMSVVADQEAALAAVGIEATGDVVTSAMAAGSLVSAGERVLVAGGAGIFEAVEAQGAEAVMNSGEAPPDDVDTVIVGLHRDFDYARLRSAATAIRRGARLIGTNSDPTYPTPRGPEPGGGSLLVAVASAGGVEPLLAGKPHEPMARLISSLVGGSDGFDPARTLMVGDRPDTDGLFADTVGCPFALVRSGVTPPDRPLDRRPVHGAEAGTIEGVAVHHDAADLGALVAALR